MKKTNDKTGGTDAAAKRRPTCLMAYTLNNKQPVVCTLVADQPYFYLDDECGKEDDVLGLEDYAEFERDLADLKKKMDAFERVAKSCERDPARRLEEFAAASITLCEEMSKPMPMIQPADRITRLLSHSRVAQALLDFARDHNVHVIESDQVQTARYDADSGRIFLHPSLGDAQAVMMAVRELRRHWQHRKGALIHPLTFQPEHAVLINRAQIADLTVSMIRAAWELQLAGERDCWTYIEQSSLADLGRVFAREAFVDFRSIASGKALSSVFESWFLSERCRQQDKKLIQAMLADHQGYVFSDEDASRMVTTKLITALGEQPYGKNYLAHYAQMIVEDPVFAEIRDRSNANFLWFIKFERSFRETEQALQDGGQNEADVLSDLSPQEGTEDNDFHPIVIPLTRNGQVIHSSVHDRNGRHPDTQAGGENVILVRFGDGQSA